MAFACAVIAALLASLVVMTRLWPRPATELLTSLQRSLAGLRRAEIEIEGARIVYLEGGSGPPLVLLHGIGADKDNFLRVARRLGKQYRLIIPDLPGFGESTADVTESYDIASQVRRLHCMVLALQLKHLHLGGNYP